MNIWRVKYSTRIDPGSGSQPWDGFGKRPHIRGLIGTDADSLESVRESIRSSLGCQGRLAELCEAEWLGETINDIGTINTGVASRDES